MRRALNAIIIFSAVAGFALELSAQSTSLKEAMELFRQRQWADAAKAFAECEKSDPGRTDALLYRGKSLLNLGQFDGAASALETYRETHCLPYAPFTVAGAQPPFSPGGPVSSFPANYASCILGQIYYDNALPTDNTHR